MDVNDILIFVRVVEAGSFSKAARRLKMPISTVSRRLARLEAQLKVPLLLRTTRSLKITDVGRAYFAHGQVIASELERAEALSDDFSATPQGVLRITATADFGNVFLSRVICEFLEAQPRVRVDAVLTDRVVDLIGEGFDLGIRMGELEDSSLLAKKIGTLESQLFASPAYLETHDEVLAPADLARQECLSFTGEGEAGRGQWFLRNARGVRERVKIKGRVATNDMGLIRSFAVAGHGIALMPLFMCAEEVSSGRLRALLPQWRHSAGPIHVVYPGQRFLLPKVRTFIDHLAQSCASVPWLSSDNR